MKIKVDENGSTVITADIPVFVGATAGDDSGDFPLPGVRVYDFWCQPKPGTAGYLVFDHEDVERRTPTSPTFLYYEWQPGGKLVYHRGLRRDRPTHNDDWVSHPQMGIVYRGPKTQKHGLGMLYCSWTVDNPSSARKVGILDMLRFIEGRIKLEELDKLAIE